MKSVIKRTYARVALIGNPSDGFEGKTIAIPIDNFRAEVILAPSDKINFIPNDQDRLQLPNLKRLKKDVKKHGYYGGIRLLKASAKKFYDYCLENNINLEDKSFTLTYSTNIPRQMGLGGSSAIIISALKALFKYYKVEIKKPILANLALSVETEELDISAGLQDRVVQSYSYPIYMDFSRQAFAKNKDKYGVYKRIDKKLLPKMFLIYSNSPSQSGKVHSKIGFRYKKGDKTVVGGMKKLAKLTDRFWQTLKKENFKKMAQYMNHNFALRRKMYGDGAIGKRNLTMIKLPRKIGLPSKFSGSGGAIIGLYQKKRQFVKLKKLCSKNNFKLIKIK